MMLLALSVGCAEDEMPFVTPEVEVAKEYQPLVPIRVSYGEEDFQYADLRIPEGDGPFPVVMIIHGGCWLSQYDLSLMDNMALDLAIRGFATWNIEYRRTEDAGGGWPGTFTDVGNALKHLEILAVDHPLDVESIVVTGHSAGGHLALMLGAQGSIAEESQIRVGDLPKIKGIVSLAGIIDLATYYSTSGCGSNTDDLVGGTPEEVPARYIEGSPISYLPMGIPQVLIHGENDNIVSIAHATPYFERAKSTNEEIELVAVPDADHFAVITPSSAAWSFIVQAIEDM